MPADRAAVLLLLVAMSGMDAAVAAPHLPAPPPNPVTQAVDGAVGSTVVPAVDLVYRLAGQNITREDVRIFVDLNFTQATMNVAGLLVGSALVNVQADIHARMEMRVLSAERIRKLVVGAGGDNVTGENATFLEKLYLPAEAFRASLTAEAAAAFQSAEETALGSYLAEAVPEMQVLELRVGWENVLPTDALTDLSLTEPPIVAKLDLVAQYLRVESVPSLLDAYFHGGSGEDMGKQAYVDRLKRQGGDPPATRDFFAAAAYTQLLNLSMQPGWSLDMDVRIPRGYAFTYVAGAAQPTGDRSLRLHVDGMHTDRPEPHVLLASITQPRAVALALFAALWAVALLAALPVRFAYGRWRIPRFRTKDPAIRREAAKP
jgi:hypothetical protein